ncbi:hypothetical protein LRR18_08575 [Mangrovimonas sp. AS39]|uniref:hypothetical protein n=1 Tax=Mangrovimonas futianensis TaxID=2895523 RepID=UPI001E5ACD54|nr:hypothetical protein [Mangrovimonas futianensis]MCF1191636.1 hypothetical protein [Mangrovimonas futianensis]MCF1195476.1 hypothetical protein [Mangrovimonas futianensis]
MKKLCDWASFYPYIIGAFFLLGCSSQDTNLIDENAGINSNMDVISAQKKFDKLNMFKGPQVDFGSGKVRSWISVDKDDFPVELGIEITPEALADLESLPGDDVITSIPFHLKAKQLTPYEHIGLNWEPMGHAPEFWIPHFDVHFFEISDAERLQIPIYDANNQEIVDAVNVFPEVNKIPVGFLKLPGQLGYYPYTGKHWLPVDFLEVDNDFDTAIIHGSYNQKHVFLETKFALDFLESASEFSSDFTQPLQFEKSDTNYPTKYNMWKDEGTGHIFLTLSDFVPR